jgi:hypothetical protein
MRILSFYLLLPLGLLAAACASSSEPRLPDGPKARGNSLIRPSEPPAPGPGVAEEKDRPYHSAYHTQNPYLDGRNLILDGYLQEAVDVLTRDIYELDYPNRAALWVFICKCRLGDPEGARQFLKEYIVPMKLDPADQRAVAVLLRYYLGGITDRDLMKRFAGWDDLDNCAAYYYYGAYKKYYKKDLVNGNDYIARALRTKMFDYSEYKFAEIEILGYTAREVGAYKDFPIAQAPHREAGFLEPLEEDVVSEEAGEMFDEGDLPPAGEPFGTGTDLLLEETKPSLPLIPENVGEDRYVIPSLDKSGWEVVDERQLLASFKQEAVMMIDNLLMDSPYFYLDDEETIQFYPLTRNFMTYAVAFDDYMEDSNYFEERYHVEFTTVSLYLSKGDFLAGVKLPCRTYDYLSDLYGDDVFVTVNLLFTVNEDRTVELVHKFSKVF